MLNSSVPVGDGAIHQRKRVFSSREFFFFSERVVLCFDFFELRVGMEVMTSNPLYFLFTVQGANRLQPFLVSFVVVLDPVQLHYPHFSFITM